MKELSKKRARLRRELQEAHATWISATECPEGVAVISPLVGFSGRPDASKAEWVEYQAAKGRLTLAYAERATAA